MNGEQKVLNATGMMISPYILAQMLSVVRLRWRMHPAQVASIQGTLLALDGEYIVEGQASSAEIGPELPLTLFGIPVSIDDSQRDDVICLEWEGSDIGRIESLAIPSLFSRR